MPRVEAAASSSCRLCPELAGDIDTDFHRRTQRSIESRILFSSKCFTILPDISPIVPGHLLICTTRHVIAMSALGDEEFRQLDRIIAAVSSKLTEVYGEPTIFFEHGAVDEFDRAGCCLDHAHLHALPINVDVTVSLRTLFDEVPVRGLETLSRFARNRTPYLFFQRTDGQRSAYAPVHGVSQFVRRLICMELGAGTRSNWEQCVSAPMVRSAIASLGEISIPAEQSE